MNPSSRMTSVKMTLTIDGDEQDVFVQAFVTVEPGLGMGGSRGAELDSGVDVMIHGTLCPLDSVNVGEGDERRITDALCDVALEDHEDLDADEYEEAS